MNKKKEGEKLRDTTGLQIKKIEANLVENNNKKFNISR